MVVEGTDQTVGELVIPKLDTGLLRALAEENPAP
jgi:hypothetical protein